MEYKIMIDEFQGPMDLLLHLIEKAEIDIYDIPINKISQQFIDYIDGMKTLNLDIASEFLLMAASLLEIKSKMLLPKEEVEDEEGFLIEEEDPREELVRRIVEYKKYKEAAKDLREYEELYSKMYLKPREEILLDVEEEIEFSGFNAQDLLRSFNRVLVEKARSDLVLEVDEIQREEYTLEECIHSIKLNLEEKEEMAFSQLFDMKNTISLR